MERRHRRYPVPARTQRPSLSELNVPHRAVQPRHCGPYMDIVASPPPAHPHAQQPGGLPVATPETAAVPARLIKPVTTPRTGVTDTPDPQPAQVLSQRVVGDKPAEKSRSVSRWRHVFRRHRGRALYGLAGAVFVIGVMVAVQGAVANRAVLDQAKVLASHAESSTTSEGDEAGTTSVPSEEKPKGNYLQTYAVAPQQPRILRIPSIGVEARIVSVGVSKTNEMKTPNTIYDVGWYNMSARPGESGAVVLNGHYAGPRSHGVFRTLQALKVGDQLSVERGDKLVVKYVVKQVETKPAKDIDMAKLMVPFESKTPGLNLITCGGDMNPKTFEFSSRTVVYAQQL